MSRHGLSFRASGWALALILLTASVCAAQAPISKKFRPDPDSTGTTTAPAESTPEINVPNADEPAAQESRPRGFLGDPSRFTRLGGWGGIGGTMGQFGLSKSMLIMMPPVQEELELTDEQKRQLRDWMEQMRSRGEEMGRAMQRQGGDDLRQPNMPMAQRILAVTTMMSQLGGILRENEAGVNRILDSEQRKRLTQIALQMEGISALSKPEVARALNLSPTQNIRVQELLNQSRMSQLTSWMSQMPNMADRSAGPQPAPGRNATPRRPGTARPDGQNNPPTAPRRDANDEDSRRLRAQETRQQFESMRDRADMIQERTVIQILKVLTVRQREKFDKILGEPFDPGALNSMASQRPGPDASVTPARTPPPSAGDDDLDG